MRTKRNNPSRMEKTRTSARLLRLVALAGMMLCMATAAAQEYSSIVRSTESPVNTKIKAVSEDSWLACIKSGNSKGFYLVTEGEYTVPAVHACVTGDVTDFDISGSTVYFCGNTTLPGGGDKAVVGHFELSDFPSGWITYDTIPNFRSVDHILCTHSNGRLHLIISATDNNGVPNMIDAIDNNLFWRFRYGVIDSNYHVTDMVETDSMIVVSTVLTSFGSIASSKVWMLKKSILSNGSFFSTPGHKFYSFPLMTLSSRVTHLTGDVFATTYTISGAAPAFFSVYFFRKDMSLFGVTVTSYARAASFNTLDMEYNPISGDVDVATRYTTGLSGTTTHTIYHIPTDITDFGATLTGHTIPSYAVQSIDYLDGNPDHFISSGQNTSNNRLQISRYKYDDWGSCTNMSTHTYSLQQQPIYPLVLKMPVVKAINVFLKKNYRDFKNHEQDIICED